MDTDCGEQLKFLFLSDCGEQLKFLFLSDCGEQLKFLFLSDCGEQLKFLFLSDSVQCGMYNTMYNTIFVISYKLGLATLALFLSLQEASLVNQLY